MIGCDSIPHRDKPNVISERNNVMESARGEFKKCLSGEKVSMIYFKFTLFRTEELVDRRPFAVVYNKKTGEDKIEIKILLDEVLKNGNESCLKSKLKGLKFKSVYPTVLYMEEHEYRMSFGKKTK